MQTKREAVELTACPGCGQLAGPRAKYCSECGRALRPPVAASVVPAALAPPPLALAIATAGTGQRRPRTAPVVRRAERRQLTVMFCDLVGSTELSTRMDPEELSELLGGYRALVQGEVETLGGTTARFLGDGVLVYFGYPLAHEDDAIRAVRAALNIVRGMQTLGAQPGNYPPQSLQVHLGVHTGMVLIDHTQGGGVGDIIGETPNLAAKVEELAPPDTVLVSSATHDLTADLFDYAPWGPLELKGFSPSIELFRLIGERDWRRDDGPGRNRPKQFFGRTHETTRLARLWREARGIGGHAADGQPAPPSGRVAAIVGEPGIGKTRLTQWAADHVESTGSPVIRFYCAEEAVDTPFWSVSETISSLCRLSGQPPAAQLHRLRRIALRAGLPPDRFVPAMADLLSLAVDPPAPTDALRVPLTAEGRRQRLVDMLLAWVATLAGETPLLLIVENVHWVDPSSRALLAELARRASTLRLLILITARPQPEPPLAEVPRVERFVLDRLPPHDLEAMLTALWRDAILPSDMQRQLLDKCDGVPLFLEQLVKTVAERVHRGGSAGSDVPTSLRDMLAARLDRLGPAKLIALAASVIGRQFPKPLLRALLARRVRDIEGGLALLVKADIIRPVPGLAGALGEPAYKFRHALLRDAAYDSLLRSERAKYHRTLARAYRKHYAALVEAQPELVARHTSAAGEHEEALEYWWKAGLRARARSANREATAHFRAGIADAERLEEPEERQAQVIRFTMATARAAFAAEGFASPEVERLNNRALALVEQGSLGHMLPAVLGAMFSYYQVRGPLRSARDCAERLLRLHASLGDLVALASNKRRLGWCAFCAGDIRAGTALLDEALTESQAGTGPKEAGLSMSDTAVIGQANLGLAESFAGDIESAARRCAAAVDLARRRYSDMAKHTQDVGNMPGDLAYALCLSAAVAKQAQDPGGVAAFAGEARDFAIAHDLPYWRAWATVLLGWGVAHTEADRGTALLLEGIEAYKATGARLFVPYNLALLAEAHMAFGRITDGLACVAEALDASAEIEAAFMDAELFRIKARLMAQAGDTGAALATLTESIALAERHGAATIRQWAERDHRFLIDGTRGPPGLLLATAR